MARSKSSGRWLHEHFNDAYVREAQKQGYRSRAAFKLLEIQRKDRLLKPGMRVVDLGAAPGGWTQVAAREVGAGGLVVALDILAMDQVEDARVIQADFTEDAALAALDQVLGGQPVDLVLSDMAPNISGVKAVDQPRAMHLAELALDFADSHLKPGGDFLVKIFQGEGFDEYLRLVRQGYRKVLTRKPASSRGRSREMYLLARQKQV
ncbi:23S rRNA (uridine2552-2'-O)-methyltransferase [Natronocella acetinitrilica]|uniref:Ribosomal RNA large subunit methyltransferase E n=1 Tax=Natronocella acetinitrilica TaxID=414046 RepID=A0AAE3G3X1_9GAMM|nr:23S rRNA (uridine(2552)-2'-O)-methyltransferase RlmE [Natronocella acetinitrilica]MCP1674723.1 23S rRNA (uridine2552-2'-O)-methyltransferase [Natronocella acetinitrilica]